MIIAIVLAAGSSSRMGDRNKLLLPIEGEALVSRVVGVLLQSAIHQVGVVLGHQSEEVAAALTGHRVDLLYNGAYPSGMASSIVKGVGYLPEGTEGFFIVQGDMPNLDVDLINTSMTTFLSLKRDGQQAIVAPAYQGKWGNPVLFDAAYAGKLKTLTGDQGARKWIKAHPDQLHLIEVDHPNRFLDLDTPEAYQKYVAQLED
ncbi:MAG: nucleotidyltransferase family protein [Bacteroidota bacterium]